MKRCVHLSRGASRGGFTLLEICIVLLIIGILLGAMMPAIQSAFTESAMRADARQLSLLVKTAMLQSTDQHRTYVMDLTATDIDLHPAGAAPKEDDADSATDKKSPDAASDNSAASYRLDRANKLLIPDPKRPSAWIHMPSTSWIFLPGELCPATRVRLARGNAWMEMSFNALTGNVENETAYFP